MSAEFQLVELKIPAEMAGERLDVVLARLLPQQSRTRIKSWIESGAVRVARATARPADRVQAGARVTVEVTAPVPHGQAEPEAIALHIVHEDRDCLVIDKPAGLVVHPGAGNPCHTLQNALLGFDAALAALPRAGLIHRLDKDTSGLLIVARTPEAHTRLVAALQLRAITREYLALCLGRPTGGGRIEEPIGRHRSARTRMAVRADGRPAVTHFRIEERFGAHTLLRVRLETGRTHQIRVHLAHIGLPVVGDPLYGGRARMVAGLAAPQRAALQAFRRQALHAQRLQFSHPLHGGPLSLEAALPADLQSLLALLRQSNRDASETDAP
jgi:23S rRNA pseudouridine1911/1915/1917 synthase